MASDEHDKRDKEPKDKKGESLVGETLKKVLSAGVGAAFMSEEGIRSYLSDLKLPKELLGMLIQSASKGKDEITQRVSKEVIGIVSKIDWVKEIAKFAETHKFKITAEIDVIKKSAVEKSENK